MTRAPRRVAGLSPSYVPVATARDGTSYASPAVSALYPYGRLSKVATLTPASRLPVARQPVRHQRLGTAPLDHRERRRQPERQHGRQHGRQHERQHERQRDHRVDQLISLPWTNANTSSMTPAVLVDAPGTSTGAAAAG
ncbi:hypothetical protein GCM10022214_47000 [Actinomadura miaoliensis]|uniref:Uncharacterized protein n=1 Tax=Actinomadura miaoliensis TaxID=430685 RepID=A0ABP7W8H7_9ACTN